MRHDSSAGQEIAKLEASAEEAHLGIGRSQTQSVGGFLDREPVQIPEQEYRLVFLVQLGQGLVQQALGLVFKRQLVGRLPAIGKVYSGCGGASEFTGARAR